MTSRKKLGILLSGRGSNFDAIADSIQEGRLPAEIAVVISNRADAPGLESAKRRGLKTLLIPSKGRVREEHDREVIAALRQARVDLVCLAGYMRLLSPEFVRAFPNRILNIHPSLLPAFPGLEVSAFVELVAIDEFCYARSDNFYSAGPIESAATRGIAARNIHGFRPMSAAM